MVPADSQQISRARCYSGDIHESLGVFVYRAITVYGRPFQTTSTNTNFSDCCSYRQIEESEPHYTVWTTPAGYHIHTV